MKLKRLFFLLAIGLLTFSCNNKSKNNNPGAAALRSTPAFNFFQTDSVEWNYYPNPKNEKEKETFMIKDTAFINALANNLQLQTVEKEECPHNIKMYLFNKGDVYKTVYAAVEDSCNYLAYAVSGKPYFIQLNEDVKNRLINLRSVQK